MIDIKYCRYCKRELKKRSNESIKHFNQKRAYCDLKCKNNDQKGKTLKNCENKNHCTGENNWRWRGDEVGYSGLHRWINKHINDKNKCEYCGETNKLNWANKSGKYLRIKSDWIRLCSKCHARKDKVYLKYYLPKSNTSGYRGVYFEKKRGKWIARISNKYIGGYPNKIDAAKAYDKESKKMWGNQAVTNF